MNIPWRACKPARSYGLLSHCHMASAILNPDWLHSRIIWEVFLKISMPILYQKIIQIESLRMIYIISISSWPHKWLQCGPKMGTTVRRSFYLPSLWMESFPLDSRFLSGSRGRRRCNFIFLRISSKITGYFFIQLFWSRVAKKNFWHQSRNLILGQLLISFKTWGKLLKLLNFSEPWFPPKWNDITISTT